MNEYFFKVYFKDNKTGVPFVVPVSKLSSTLEAARQKLFVECHLCEDIYNCKLLYIYTDTDMISAMTTSINDIMKKVKVEGDNNED